MRVASISLRVVLASFVGLLVCGSAAAQWQQTVSGSLWTDHFVGVGTTPGSRLHVLEGVGSPAAQILSTK